MNVEYEHWTYDEWATLDIPSGDPREVGDLLGEMMWCLWQEVSEAGAPAIDYEEALQPRRPMGSTVTHMPRGIVAVERLAQLRRLVDAARAGLPEEQGNAWCRRHLSRRWNPETGGYEPQTYEAVGALLGRDRKTVARWCTTMNERLCEQLDARGWQL